VVVIVSEADKIMNSKAYIKNIFVRVATDWPKLYNHVFKGAHTLPLHEARNNLKKIIGYDGVNTYDGIIKYIQKNEHMMDWWLL